MFIILICMSHCPRPPQVHKTTEDHVPHHSLSHLRFRAHGLPVLQNQNTREFRVVPDTPLIQLNGKEGRSEQGEALKTRTLTQH